MPSPFDFANDLSHDKKHLLNADPDCEKAINQFMINRIFSFGVDTILYANEMNKARGINNQMFYDYYFYSLRARKRFNKWVKPEKEEYLADVMEYHKFGYAKAMSALKILTVEQLEQIRNLLKKGGR